MSDLPPSSPPSSSPSPSPVARRLGAVGLDIVVNIALPLAIYLYGRAPWGPVPALIASSAPPVLWSVVELVRSRRLDALSLIVLAGIALSLLAFVGGGSVKALQLREKYVTLLIGLAFLGSAAIGKPLIWYLAKATEARRSQQAAAALEANRDRPALRRAMNVMTLVWGFGLVAEFAVGVVLVYALPIAEYLVIGPIVGYATLAGLGFWTFRYARASRRRGQAVSAAAASSVGVDPPDASR
jgi:hypothetical protein